MQWQKGRGVFKVLLSLDFCTHARTKQLARKAAEKVVAYLSQNKSSCFLFLLKSGISCKD